MRRQSGVVIGISLGVVLIAPDAIGGQESRPLSPVLEITTGRYFVGQAIEAAITVTAGELPPKLSIGTRDGVSVLPLRGIEIQPKAASGIGNKTRVENRYRFPIRIVPQRSGQISLPSMRIIDGSRTAVVPPRTLTSLPPPALGRTSSFLGGVGNVSSRLEARPTTVSLGESIELRWQLQGSGSIGSIAPAKVIGLDPKTWDVRILSTESDLEPPSRTFRYQLKPTLAGRFTIGPLLITTLDPASSSYRTTSSKAVVVNVIDVPEFTPAPLPDFLVATSKNRRPNLLIGLGSLGLGFALLLLYAARFARRRRTKINLKQFARTLGFRIQRAQGPAAVSFAVRAALSEFLNKIAGTPPGPLTPKEARRVADSLSLTVEVGEELEQVVDLLDRALYARSHNEQSEEGLRGRATTLLTRIAEELRSREAGKTLEAST